MQRKPGRMPSGHLSRLKPAELDPLAEYGLPSKGEKRLLAPKIQESYYAKIASRYLAFCTSAGDRASLDKQFAQLSLSTTTPSPLLPPPPLPQQPSTTSNPPPNPTTTPDPATTTSAAAAATDEETIPQILAALRKLREALLASRRHDHFATQVYLFSARLGILAGAWETYYPALLHLLRAAGQARFGGGGTGVGFAGTSGGGNGGGDVTSVERHEVVGYLVLDAACRRGDLAEAYALRNRHRLADGRVDAVLRALAADNWVAWRRVRMQVDGYRARLMELAEARVRGHTLRAFGRAYLTLPLDVLEVQAGVGWAELRAKFGVGWELDGKTVVIRKVKAKG